ncbi:tRNA (adenosine(37)-N6)-threonylcarbamoyltransferase complex dimerization subunit type 1 TsaB [Haliea sp. E17]|uniref:tRNA (adenosine(37)-N6)-threonylcarbamoyltransferase complex dimerization subunit type 1 TsaB n=1 Tax=Haliea sp. E17 TaxID=3401576 RepID=UPI003AAD5DCA
MKGILAIETATDACSVALWRDGAVTECHEVIPRQHSQRLFSMLAELLPGGNLRDAGVEAIAYGAGPGSFTGLRVAASAVQGLCFAAALPAIPVSTLACQVQSALREGLVEEGQLVASLIDARINEIYGAVYRIEGGLPQEVVPAQACAPQYFQPDASAGPVTVIGSGARFLEAFSPDFRQRIAQVEESVLPHSGDLLPLALAIAATGGLQNAMQVQPVYVRDEISWKKISEQGKRK